MYKVNDFFCGVRRIAENIHTFLDTIYETNYYVSTTEGYTWQIK